ncbi:PhnB protein [Luteibacter rhizovicinus]|uniref:PhnB protein n=1 Tax=Luteibacter rhizovicinus TaxID=242606 RepID=A0A4R3YVH8_9GAMM|nr:VOC family protein [Luteibacter rhizovicinus]TCV96456.1 PhnB protein [Luteibacter rhizovicinus]
MKLQPYLIFNGNCEEAFTFYEKALGGKIAMISRFKEMPASPEPSSGEGCGPGEIPANWGDKLMHIRLEIGDQVLMGSDSHPAYPYNGIHGCNLAVVFDDVAQAERAFKTLSEGGQVTMPFAPTFWAKGFGMCIDKFGAPWMINGPQI